MKILSQTKLKFHPTQAAWYVYPNFDNYAGALKKKGVNNSYELAEYLIKEIGLISVAGECFNYPCLNLRLSIIDVDIKDLKNLDVEKLDLKRMKKGLTLLKTHLESL